MTEGDPQVQQVMRELQRRVDAGSSRAKVLQILVAQYESGKRTTFPIKKKLDEFTVVVLAMVAKKYGVRAIRVDAVECSSRKTMRAFMNTITAMRGQIASVELTRGQLSVLEALIVQPGGGRGYVFNPTVTEIKIKETPASLSVLVRILSFFPNLQKLHLDCSKHAPLEDAQLLGTILLPRLRNLKILELQSATLSSEALIALGEGAKRCPTLRDIELEESRGYDLASTRLFLTLIVQSHVMNLSLMDSAPWETHGQVLGRFLDAFQEWRRRTVMAPPPPRVPALDDTDKDPGDWDGYGDSQREEIEKQCVEDARNHGLQD